MVAGSGWRLTVRDLKETPARSTNSGSAMRGARIGGTPGARWGALSRHRAATFGQGAALGLAVAVNRRSGWFAVRQAMPEVREFPPAHRGSIKLISSTC